MAEDNIKIFNLKGKTLKLKKKIPAKEFLEVMYQTNQGNEEKAALSIVSLLYKISEEIDEDLDIKELMEFTNSKQFQDFLASCMGKN